MNNSIATLQIDINWNPCGDFLMLLPELLPDKTAGGIILPDGVYRKTCRGRIIKMGPDITGDMLNRFTIGDEVFFPQNTDFEICVNEELDIRVYLVHVSDVIMSRTVST